MMTIVKKINPQSPLGRLIQEKRDLRNQCRESETRIKENWQYIQSHAGQLLGAGVASVLIPGRKNNYANGDGAGFMNIPWVYFIWRITRPVVYRWMGEAGWRILKSMFRKKR